MTLELPEPLLLAWAAFNTFVSLSAFVGSRRDTALGAVVFTLFGVVSVLLLKLGLLDLFIYYEMGICLLQLTMAINFLDGDHPGAKSWITFSLGRCYLAVGVWFLSTG